MLSRGLAARTQAVALRNFEKEQGIQFRELVNKHPSAKLQQIGNQDIASEQVFEAGSLRNKQEAEQQLKEIRPHLERLQKAIIADIEQAMNINFNKLTKITATLPEEQRASFETSLNKLRVCQDALAKTSDVDKIRNLSKQFTDELSYIKGLLQPHVPESTIQEINQNIEMINKLPSSLEGIPTEFNPYPIETPVSQSRASAAASSASLVMTRAPNSPNPADSAGAAVLSEEQVKKQKGVPPLAISEIREQPLNEAARFRAEVIVIKSNSESQNHVPAPSHEQKEVEQGAIVELDESAQENLKELLSNVSFTIDDKTDQEAFNSKEKTPALELHKLCEKMTRGMGPQVLASDVKLINKYINELKIGHSEFEDYLDTLDTFTALSDSPSPP